MNDLKLYVKTDKGLDSLTQTVRIFSSNICLDLGIEKCSILTLKKGIKDENCHIMLPKDLKISSLKKGENYKCLSTLVAEDINTKKMKEKVKVEYLNAPEKFLSQNSIVEISSKL